LAAVPVPAMAMRRLYERLAMERATVRAPRNVPRGMIAASAILTVGIFAMLTFFSPARVPAPSRLPAVASSSAAVDQTIQVPAPSASAESTESQSPAIHKHRRNALGIASPGVPAGTQQPVAERPAKRERRTVRLTEQDEVK
jgi:hypothetical protein